MSFIQVSLGQGISKFPKLKQSIPEFTKKEIDTITANSDLQFLHDLSEGLRLIIEHNDGTTSGDMITIMPDTGSTFYFLGAVVLNDDPTTDGVFHIDNAGTIREQVTLTPDTSYEFKIPMDRLVGNMSDSFTLVADTANVNSRTSLWGWVENTKKIA